MDGVELELLLSLDGAAYEMAPGVVVEPRSARTASATRWFCGRKQAMRHG
jgi:hypothetical protein